MQAEKPFTIFCDENAGVPLVKPVSAKVHQDKENVLPQRKPVSKGVPLGSVKVVENFSDSSDTMETDSPMVLDTSIQSEKQWRVPPLGQHQPETADVFAVDEYAEVSKIYFWNISSTLFKFKQLFLNVLNTGKI